MWPVKKKHVASLSPSSRSDLDLDPYSMSIVEQLLNKNSEWSEQDQIVKLTFRALVDIVQIHSQSIKDLKAIITTRASKNQLSTGLALKANASDLGKVTEDLASGIDSKVSYNDINSILKEYAHKADIKELFLQRLDSSDNKGRAEKEELEMKIMQKRIDQFQKQITKRLGACVSLGEFQQLLNIIDQKVNVSELNQVLQNRVTKQYLATCLQKKTSKAQLQQLLARKVDSTDLQYIITSLQSKASLSTIEKLTQVIENKADRSDLIITSNQKANKSTVQEHGQKLSQFSHNVETKLNQFRREVDQTKFLLNQGLKFSERESQLSLRNFVTTPELDMTLNHLKKNLEEQCQELRKNIDNLTKDNFQQMKYENFVRELTHQINLRKSCEEKLYDQIDNVRKRAEQISAKSLNKTQFFNFRSQLAEMLEEKIETEYVQQAFNKWEVELNSKMTQDKEQVLTLINRIQKTLSDNIAVNSADIMNLASYNKRKDPLESTISQQTIRKIRREVEECRKTVDSVYHDIQSRINVSEYENDLLQIRKKFDNISCQLSLKASIKDVCVLADSKPNIDDVNKALEELNAALDEKVSDQDLQNILKDQASINETLCSENIVGRWLWRSGSLKAGGLIPWEIECANTIPDHFFWEKDKSSILVLAAGIYELTACIFSKAGSIIILINGEPLNQKTEENNTLSSNSLKKSFAKRKKDTEYSSTKVNEFVILPARSRISASCLVEGGEAFFNIRRL